ncbi:hypothetical protein DBV15_09967 [Temnothorax longispinosus]|uniref:Uncharacterized protein n=1 Tax=Temnothorax longispinosus TaxID=300112 RepID=A0A4S2KK13_9HYME|nr:hypothetical protein DBV15_09967 [Temnothorax longispinosus]
MTLILDKEFLGSLSLLAGSGKRPAYNRRVRYGTFGERLRRYRNRGAAWPMSHDGITGCLTVSYRTVPTPVDPRVLKPRNFCATDDDGRRESTSDGRGNAVSRHTTMRLPTRLHLN